MLMLGFMAQVGRGGARDYAAARQWYEKCADEQPAAYANLGQIYAQGWV